MCHETAGLHGNNFYSRPCGRGDELAAQTCEAAIKISTHAPAGGATSPRPHWLRAQDDFYSRPCGRGDGHIAGYAPRRDHFYSRPCGRGDPSR